MLKKKLIIPMVFILVLIVSMFSGCNTQMVPVDTYEIDENPHGQCWATGQWSSFCKAKGQKFVWDYESHENWEDYGYTIEPYRIIPIVNVWWSHLDDLPREKLLYFRAVAYCFDFWGPLKDFEEGWWQGDEVHWVLPYL